MRKLFIICVLVNLLFILTPISAAQLNNIQTSIRQKTKFNNDWRFILGDKPEFRDTTYDDSAWRQLNLPHDWSIEGAFDKSGGESNGFFPIGIGWYRKTFTLSDSLKGKEIVINFDGVYMNSEVWINNHFLGRYPYGYSTFQYDMTDFLKFGEKDKNVIAVRVDNSLPNSTRWYSGSGIYRNVYLITTNFVHFHNYKGVSITTPEVEHDKALLNIDYDFLVSFYSHEDKEEWQKDIWKSRPVTKNITIRSIVYNQNGTEISRTESQNDYTNFNPDFKVTQQLTINNPSRWSPNSPVLYYLKSQLECEGKILDDQVTSFGIRKLEFILNKGMFVNGVPTKFKGACVHEDAASFGSAAPMEVWQYRLLKLKKMGCNAIRPSHHPFNPKFYDLCDSLGFFIMDEAFDEWTRGWEWNFTENTNGKATNGYHLYFNQWWETDLKAMIYRDRNHPSVVLYSIGNEIPNQLSPDGAQLAKKLVDVCHQEDPTRPVTSACDQAYWRPEIEFLDVLDIGGFNYVDRKNKEKTYAPEREVWPNKLFVGSETSNQVWNWIGVRDLDYVIGEFPWTGVDYLGEARYPVRAAGAGWLDLSGNEKSEYYLRKSYYSEEPTVHITIDTTGNKELPWYRRSTAVSKWNWETKDTLPVYVYTNCDEVELLLNGKSLGKKNVDMNLYKSLWKIQFQPGTIKAIGYRKGKKVAEHVLKTAGDAFQISAKPLKTKLKANGEDLALIEISILDKNGNYVYDANNDITVNISGEGELAGLDNGDTSYPGLFKTNVRKAFHGKLLATVRSSNKAGKMGINITSNNLHGTKLNIETE
jgi:beta-galactosidase